MNASHREVLPGVADASSDVPLGRTSAKRSGSSVLVSSLDHLVRARQQCRRKREAERLGGREVDHQLELRRLLDRQVGRLRASEDLVDLNCTLPSKITDVGAVGDE